MSPRITGAIAARVLAQLRHDHRTLAMLLLLPCLILALLRWMYDEQRLVFDSLGPALLALDVRSAEAAPQPVIAAPEAARA